MADIKNLMMTKLNSTNYCNWKFKAELLLRSKGLWKKVIVGARPEVILDGDGAVTNQAGIDVWDEKDDEARGIIGLSIDEDQIALIRTKKTAKEFWDTLKDYYEKNTLTNKVSLMRAICSMKLIEGGDAKAHINKMTDLFTKLNDIGGEGELSDGWSAAILLGSLPQSYDTLITTLESRREDELTFALVKQRVIAEYERHSPTNSDTDSILKIVASGKSCYFCKDSSHIKKDCGKYKKWLAKKTAGNGSNNNKSDKVNGVQESEAASKDFLFAIHEQQCIDWLIDSGATRFAVNDVNFFKQIDKSYRSSVKVATGEKSIVRGIGSGYLTLVNEEGNTRRVMVNEVLYAPDLVASVISVKKLAKMGFRVEFDDTKCEIKYKGEQIAVGDVIGELYVLRRFDTVCAVLKHNDNCIHSLHRRMGHRDPGAIRKMFSNGSIKDLKIVECGIKEVCDTCTKGKMTRLSFPKKSNSESLAPLDLIHTDVCGPMNTASRSGKRYIVTFIDDFSSFTIIRLITHKSDVESSLKEFIEFCKTKFGRKPKVIRSDRGGEYTGKSITNYFKSEGIQSQLTAAYSPQQNGKAERKNRTLIEMARCMLIDAKLPHSFWGEAVATANFIQNRVITRSTNTTPYERWNGTKPGINEFQIFGSKCFVHIPSERRKKLDNVAIEMIFLGYDEQSKAYRCYDTNTRKVIISRDVRFSYEFTNEENVVEYSLKSLKANIPVQQQLHEGSVEEEMVDRDEVDEEEDQQEEQINDQDEIDEEEDQQEEQINDRNEANKDNQQQEEKIKRVSHRDNKGKPPIRLGIDEVNVVNEIKEPKNYREAINSDERQHWLTAMQIEMESHERNNTWELVDLPTGRTAIDGKWVFKIKTSTDGEITRYKARFVARGFSQKYGEDYDEVFAPVVLHTTLRTLLSVAAQRKMLVHHLDAETAFLNGKLNETIYMRQPEGFQGDDSSKVCLLRKSIYGLKQAARSWNSALHDVLISAGFKQSYNDPCLYSSKINGRYCYMIVYVDDLLVVCYSSEQMKFIEDIFKPHFKMQNMGPIQHYLGMKISRDAHGNYQVCQPTYIDRIINDFGLKDAKTAKTPMDLSYGKTNSGEELESNSKYRSLIGRLLYLAINTRPDISASVSILAQKVCKPTSEDWNQLKRVVKYLKSTPNLKLKLSNVQLNEQSLHGYADATWADDRNDRKSNSGRIFYLNGGTISWTCHKQSIVAQSSCEAEFISMAEAANEAKWLRQLLEEMHIKIDTATIMYEDNQGCIELLRDSKFSYKTKHIDTKFKMIRDIVKKEIIKCVYCPTEEMIADLLTKPLSFAKHEYLREKCNLI